MKSYCDVPVSTVPDKTVDSFTYIDITPGEIVIVVKAIPCEHSAGRDAVLPFPLKDLFKEILCVPLATITSHEFHMST